MPFTRRRIALFASLGIFAFLLTACPNPANNDKGPGASTETSPDPETTPVPGTELGSEDNPYPLAVGTPFTHTNNATGQEHFAIDIGSSGIYDITVSGSAGTGFSCSMLLSTDKAGTNFVDYETSTATGLLAQTLRPNQYYLWVSCAQGSAYTITVAKTGDLTYEGSQQRPVVLSLDTPYSGKADYFDLMNDNGSYYTFTAASDGLYTFTVSNLSAGSINLKLLRNDNYISDLGKLSSWSSTSSLSKQVGLAAGKYYLRIGSSSAGGRTYTLTVSRTGAYTAEGSWASPVDIALDTAHAGKVGSVDGARFSYYRITAAESGLYDIDTSTLAGYVKVYSPSNDITPVFEDYSSPSVVSCQLTPGTWILRIGSDSYSADSTFALAVSRSGEFIQEGSQSSPVSLNPGTTHHGKAGAQGSGYQYSYYSFQTAQSGIYRIGISSLNSGTLTMNLYSDPSFFTLIGDESSTSTGLDVGLSAPGTWFLKITNYDSANKTFDIAVARSEDYVTNGTIASPIPLTLDTDNAGNANCVDGNRESFYSFTATQDGLYDVTASGLTSGASVDFDIYSDAAFSRYKYYTSLPNGIIGKAYAAGTYYLKITNTSSTAASYYLRPSLVGEYPSEGSAASPIVLGLGSSRPCKVGSQNSEAYRSYYSFTIATAGSYAITASNLPYALGFYLYNYSDFSGNVASSTSTTGIGATTLSAKAYYLVVLNSNASTSYTFDLTVAP